MRFLIDSALASTVADGLRSRGHDVVHTSEIGISSAPDMAIFDRARTEDRVVVSADTDFGTLLATTNERKPSVILFRNSDRRPSSVLLLLDQHLGGLAADLDAGCIVVIEDSRIRIRPTPFR